MASGNPHLVSVSTGLRYSAKAWRQVSKAATGLVIHERAPRHADQGSAQQQEPHAGHSLTSREMLHSELGLEEK